MDPFIEQPDYWASFHSRLIVGIDLLRGGNPCL
ncbi:MAG: hypothetical protein AAGA46_16130 [Cyanobacteria bacterium P01_F01_bin.13]